MEGRFFLPNFAPDKLRLSSELMIYCSYLNIESVPVGYLNYPMGIFNLTASCVKKTTQVDNTGNYLQGIARHQAQDSIKPDIGGSANRDAKA